MTTVKPLEWKDSSHGVYRREMAQTSIGTYSAWLDGSLYWNGERVEICTDLDAAKAAAFADYSARIMSAIEPAGVGVEMKAEAHVSGLQYRPYEFDDWGMIRDADGKLFAVVRRPASSEELNEHRNAGTDPYEDLALRLMSTFGKDCAALKGDEQ